MFPFVRRCFRRFALCQAVLVPVLACCAGGAESQEGDDWFENKVRPLLVERCLDCHGEKKQKGGLRLDSRAGWQAGGETGPAVVPGDVESSLLIKAVRGGDPHLQMPPKKPLEEGELAILEEWVRNGAVDPREGTAPVKTGMTVETGRKHWAFQPVRDSGPPVLENDHWSIQPLDRFIHAELVKAGLTPNVPADRRTLIRRASYDLTGLPPGRAEVESFENDPAPDAFGKVVDRLLASPQYGEHWARHWLDVVRYSDTKGYVYAREEKRWVQAAAYRDWVVTSLNAGMPYDQFLLKQLAADQVEPAGSPHMAAMGFLTLGRRFLGVTHDIIDDRIDVTMRGTQGLTVACARCHDHKFDPIPTRDYYALYGIFRSSAEAVVRCDQTENTDLEFVTGLALREAKLREVMTTRREEQADRVRSRIEDYLMAQRELDNYPEESFSQIIAANDLNPIFVRKWQSFLAADAESSSPLFDGWRDLLKNKAADPARIRRMAGEYGARFTAADQEWRRCRAEHPEAAMLPDPEQEKYRAVLYGPESPCVVPDEHIANIEFHFPTDVIVELWKLQGEVDRWFLQSSSGTAATILSERTKPFAPKIFRRGNPLMKGDEVPRQFLQVLSAEGAKPFSHGGGRLELAQAIASAENPLTARVMVNRVWMHHFGNGLVDTPSDFGTRAEPPSHPALLDWLAARFVEDGWSLKSLHRRLMLSAVYQQSSAPAAGMEQALKKDPENRLLWRMNPHRLTFEEMRDSWLAASGLLSPKTGGAPMALFAPGNYRRTLYAMVDRESLTSALRTFDFANPDLSIPMRLETTVPQQALFLLNHPFAAQMARALSGGKTGEENPEQRVRGLYLSLLQRAPKPGELEAALAFVRSAVEPAPSLPQPQPLSWQYGYGEWDEAAGRLKNFTPLPHFSGASWQGGSQFPDPGLGWLQLTALGGHPGDDRRHAVVRRWIAPRDGIYTINSALTHEPVAGDGVRAFVSHSVRGMLRRAEVHHGQAELNAGEVVMKAGETVDFTVDINGGLNSDQFLWSPGILASDGSGGVSEWEAARDFAGTDSAPLTAWEQLAQTLMLTNEFLFID